MPASYTVTQSRQQRMTFSGSGSNNANIKVNWHVDYFVEVDGVDPSTIGAYDVLSAADIPKVNRSVYSANGKILPYVICRDKTAKQHPDRLSRWTVTAKFSSPERRGGGGGAGSSEESDITPIDPPETTDAIEPSLTVNIGEIERVLWYEKDSALLRKQCSRTPAGNFWADPVMEPLPLFEAKITQYEDKITYKDMLERKFKVNADPWNKDAAGAWLITDVEAQEVEVELLGGTATSALVTYSIALSPYLIGGTPSWYEARALFDTQYIDAATGEVRLFANDLPGTTNVGYIDAVGEKRPNQSGEPDYIYYARYDEIDFIDFLKVP